jgi:hypothetical protein
MHSIEHSAPLIFDVDAVMKHYPAIIFGDLTERDAGAPHVMRSRSFQVRHLDTLIVRDIDVVVQVEIEPRHRAEAMPGCRGSSS